MNVTESLQLAMEALDSIDWDNAPMSSSWVQADPEICRRAYKAIRAVRQEADERQLDYIRYLEGTLGGPYSDGFLHKGRAHQSRVFLRELLKR